VAPKTKSKRGRRVRGAFAALAAATPARLGVGRAGTRYPTAALLRLRADHARAVDAVRTEVAREWPARAGMAELRSCAPNRETYLRRPELGRMLCDEDAERLAQRFARRERLSRAQRVRPSIVICVGDGLSSTAVETGAARLVRELKRRLAARYRVIVTLFVRNARVRIEDHIGEILRPDVICMIIGERPGLATAESLSAYILYHPRLASLEPDRTVISNIHAGGLRVPVAAARIAAVIAGAVEHHATGAALAAAT
jgi:ethanolamine ammonia-lyase small subunit